MSEEMSVEERMNLDVFKTYQKIMERRIPSRYWGGAKTYAEKFAGLKVLVWDSTKKQKEPESVDVVDLMLDYINRFDCKTSPMMYLYGSNGTGKTGFAYAIAHALLLQGRMYIEAWSTQRLFSQLMRTYNRESATPDMTTHDFERKLTRADLLVIDDLGAEQGTTHQMKFLSGVICERYDWEKPFIVTSNFSVEQWRDREQEKGLLDDFRRITSRMAESVIRVDFGTKDMRRSE